jgi:hypothetical protein
MMTARAINRVRYPWLDELSRTPAGRSVLLAGMRAMPWQATATEALTMKGGFADQTGFWSTLWNSIMIDVPTGLDQIDCPVVVAQGVLDVIGSGQTPRYTPLIPGARFALRAPAHPEDERRLPPEVKKGRRPGSNPRCPPRYVILHERNSLATRGRTAVGSGSVRR